MKKYNIYIPINPKPKQSVKQGKSWSGKKIFYSDDEKKKYQNDLSSVVSSLVSARNYQGQVSIRDLTFCFEMSKAERRKEKKHDGSPRLSKPDIDNLIKPLLDAIEKANIIKNDSQVWRYDGYIRKIKGLKGYIEFTLILEGE